MAEESAPENDDILQVALAAQAEISKQEAAATPTPAPAEPAAQEQPKTAEPAPGNDGAKPVEAAPEEKPPETKPPAKDWRAISAEQRAKRQAEAQAKRLPTLEAENAAIKAELQRYKELEALRDSDPLAAAAKFGLDYNKLTDAYVNSLKENPNQPPPQFKKVGDEVSQLRAELAQIKSELQSERTQRAVGGWTGEVTGILTKNPEAYELTAAKGNAGIELVKQITVQHWRETATWGPPKADGTRDVIEPGEDMPPEEAIKLAEQFYENEELKKLIATKKAQAFFAKKDAPAAKKEEAPAAAPAAKPAATSTATLSQQLKQGGGEQTNFSGEWEELAALAKKLDAQQGN